MPSTGKRKYQGYDGPRKTAKMAYSFRKRTPKVIQNSLLTETHYVDTYIASTTVTNSMTLVCVNQIAQGDTTSDRAGNQVLGKYLQYNFQWKTNVTTGAVNGALWIVLDRQANASLPLSTDVLDTSVSPLFWAMKNIRAYQDRFQILRVHRSPMASAGHGPISVGTNDGSQVEGYIDISKWDSKDRVVRFPGTIAGVPNTNAILVMYIADTPVGANVQQINGTFRFAFAEN